MFLGLSSLSGWFGSKPGFGPSLFHWGSSVIMDGRYDDDKSLVFTYGQTAFTNISSNIFLQLFLLVHLHI